MTPATDVQPASGMPAMSSQLHRKMSSLVDELITRKVDLQFAKKELEAAYIKEILKANLGNIGHSAKALGMHRNTLSKRLKELRIDPVKH